MLQFMRDHLHGKVAWVILSCVAVVFVFWGSVGLRLSGDGEQALKINGEFISPEFAYAFKRVYPTDDLVAMTLAKQGLLSSGFIYSENQLTAVIRELPWFQKEGVFSKALYEDFARRDKAAERVLRERLLYEGLIKQLGFALQNAVFVFPQTIARYYTLLDQRRDVEVLRINKQAFLKKMDISDAEVQQYYQQHSKQYVQKERVKLEYLILDYEKLAKTVQLTDEEIRIYYEQHVEAFLKPEERRFAQIKVPSDPKNPEKRPEKLNNPIEAFQQEKADADAGWFIKGDMGNTQLDEVAFGLPGVGSVSQPVLVENHWYVFKLLGLHPQEKQDLKSVKSRIQEDLVRQKANALFLEKKELLERAAFEMPDSLNEVAKEIGVVLLKTGWISKGGSAEHAAPPDLKSDEPDSARISFDEYPAVLESAFSEEVLVNRNNSPLIEISPEKVAVLRIAEYEPRRFKTLEEIKGTIQQQVLSVKAQTLLDRYTARLWKNYVTDKKPLAQLAEFDRNQALTSFFQKKDVSYQILMTAGADPNMKGLSAEILYEAFQLPKPDAKYPVQAKQRTLSDGDQALIAVGRVALGDISHAKPTDLESARNQLGHLDLLRSVLSFDQRIQKTAAVQGGNLKLLEGERPIGELMGEPGVEE
jgi:hypothetical protein